MGEKSDEISGNMKVTNLVAEINERMDQLKNTSLNDRTMRQLTDGDKFLKMIKYPPYCRAATVSELKKIISEKRKEIKDLIAKADPYTEGHQFTFSDLNLESVSEETKQELEKDKKYWEEESYWLYKCLGMCSRRGYFNGRSRRHAKSKSTKK